MRTLIASNHDTFSNSIRQILLEEGLGPSVVSLDNAVNSVGQLQPELMVVVLSPAPEFALGRLGELRVMSQAKVLAVGQTADSKMVLRVLRGGADDYIEEGELDVELRAALARLKSEISAPDEVGKTIAILSPSGGGGASTLAVNLGCALAKENKSTALVDLKMVGGDLAALLNLKPVYTLADLCQNVTRMDKVMFERSLFRHETGVHLLAPPRSLSDIKHVTTDGLRQALIMGRVLFAYTIVDVDHTFREEQLLALQQADEILLVLRLDFTSLRNTRRTLDIFKDSSIPADRVTIVANRSGQLKELPPEKVEEVLKMKVKHFIPDDPRTMNTANINGIPAVVEAPNAKVCKGIAQLATYLVEK